MPSQKPGSTLTPSYAGASRQRPPRRLARRQVCNGSRWFSRACAPDAPPSISKFAVASWNTRALCCRDERKMRKKVAHLRNVLARADVVSLQEVHGSALDIRRILNLFHRDWTWHISEGDSYGSGGVVTMFRRLVFPHGTSLSSRVLIAGRVLRSVYASGPHKFIFWNVHNQELPTSELCEVDRLIASDTNEAHADPLQKSVWLAGDLNFADALELECSLADPSGQLHRVHTDAERWRRHGAEAARWPSLRGLTEIRIPEPTHYDRRANLVTPIDRIFTSFPAWMFTQLLGQAGTLYCPNALFESQVSDHAPIWAKIVFSRRAAGGSPLPKHLFTHKDFRKNVDRLVEQTELEHMAPLERWKTHKAILRHAASQVQQRLFLDPKFEELF